MGAGGRRAGRGRRRSRPTAAGTWTACTTRTRTAAGKTYARQGGFLHDAAEFDAGFFGISPREALAMDPQQRLLLEVVVGGVRAGRDRPGVAARQRRPACSPALMYHDYGRAAAAGAEGSEGYRLTGNAGSVVSGRVAYTLGSGGAGGDGGHGVFVVVGGAASGGAGVAVG